VGHGDQIFVMIFLTFEQNMQNMHFKERFENLPNRLQQACTMYISLYISIRRILHYYDTKYCLLGIIIITRRRVQARLQVTLAIVVLDTRAYLLNIIVLYIIYAYESSTGNIVSIQIVFSSMTFVIQQTLLKNIRVISLP